MCLVLMLCTANICRSPMAAALLTRELSGTGVDVSVGSAGLIGGGAAPPAEVTAAISRYGIDLRSHRSREVTAADVAAANLIIAMSRMHLRHVVVLSPTAWPRTFTFRELLRRAGASGARHPGESLSSWLPRMHQGRDRAALLGESAADDIADPAGGPPGAYHATALELSRLTSALVGTCWPGRR